MKCCLLFLLLALSLATFGQPAARATRPNIVFILVDDLRWDELGIAGHPFIKTPNIDRIGHEGARFRNAFMTTPLCSPSRASFLTGQYAHTHGITDNVDRSAASHKLVAFPRLLHDSGYATAFIGKWHMGNDDTPRPGFDRWVSFKGQGTYLNPDINEDGKAIKPAGYITDILSGYAVEFIRRRHDKPFLVYLAHKAIHPEGAQANDGSVNLANSERFIPAERHQNLFAGNAIPRRPNYKRAPEGKPALERKISSLPPLGTATSTSDESILGRQRCLMAIEESVGEILKALKETGQLDNTILVFTSDNGYFYGEHGLSVERRLAYEESIRMPLLVRYPKEVKSGTVRDEFALNIDLAPTLLELAGLTVPKTMQGRSLAPLLKGAKPVWRNSFLVEYYSDKVFPRMSQMGYKAVRNQRWKYIHYLELDGMDELYDLKTDPYEMQNLVKEPNAAMPLRAMRAELQRLLIATKAEQPLTISTVAGNGAEGISGDGGPALKSTFSSPTQVAADRRGNLYIADYANSRIRKIDRHGIITAFAGTGEAGFAGDGGPALQAKINFPHAITVTDNGTVYFTDTKNHRVRKITPAGIITTIAGNGQAGFSGDGGSALNASLNQPEGIAVDARGNIFIADFNNHAVRKVSPDGTLTTVAGNGTAGFSSDGGLAIKASLNITPAVAADSSGNLYVCDRENHRVRKVDRHGIITTVAGNGVEAKTEKIGDGGLATAARLNRPVGLALDRAGNLYIAERNGHRVRKVTPAGIITTIAGTGVAGFNGDNADATKAMLNMPRRLTINPSGDVLYIADTGNHRIRRIILKETASR